MIDIHAVESYLRQLQDDLCGRFEKLDGRATFSADRWARAEGGGGESRVITDGSVFEKGGVNFSHIRGESMPASATAARPELSGLDYLAMGVSVVMHPANPFVPTSHANVRCFIAGPETENPVWWFGGGFDLTPYYPFLDDVVSWHQTARDALKPFGETLYDQYKAWCDRYFFLPHRQETRGVGGLFFDDLNDGGFDRCFAIMRAVGDGFGNAYAPIVERRKDEPYQSRHRQFQLLRRGRYVEFNLVYDRGTLFGLQSGGRTESILMSMPPMAAWEYRHEPADGSDEAKLSEFLQAHDWLAVGRADP